MKPKAADKKNTSSLLILSQLIRKSLIIYFISAVTIPIICIIFGWQSLENIGTGFIYGSLVLALFSILTFAGNTVPAQLSKLSLPKYNAPSVKRHQDAESYESPIRDERKRFFFMILICSTFLFITGVFLKMIW